MGVFAALILPVRWSANAAVDNSYVIEEHIRSVARPGAEFSTLRPAALRIIFGADGGIHAAIEDPVRGIAGNFSFGGRVAEARNQQAALALLFLNRMRDIGKIKYR